MPHRPSTQGNRFWAKVTFTDDCWLWNAGKFPSGYGLFAVDRQSNRAHRVAYQLVKGPIPKGKVVMHMCDVKLCVRPDHLKVGTIQDNVADKMKKGRQAKGQKVHCSKLTELQVREFICDYYLDEKSSYVLAKKYKVNASSLQRILKKICWGHLYGTN